MERRPGTTLESYKPRWTHMEFLFVHGRPHGLSLLCRSRLGKSLRWRSDPLLGRPRPLQGREIDLAHLQHRPHDPTAETEFGLSAKIQLWTLPGIGASNRLHNLEL